MEHFKTLNALDVNEKTEKKGGLTYLSWAWAWSETKKHYPNAKYEIMKNQEGLPMFGNEKIGYMVYTTVTIDEITHEMWLPVMDFKNKSMMNPTTFDVNKAVMRCLTKNLAMFGLGLYIYAGEDLPEGEETTIPKEYTKMNTLLKECGWDREKPTAGICKKYNVKQLRELSETQMQEIIKTCEEHLKQTEFKGE